MKAAKRDAQDTTQRIIDAEHGMARAALVAVASAAQATVADIQREIAQMDDPQHSRTPLDAAQRIQRAIIQLVHNTGPDTQNALVHAIEAVIAAGKLRRIEIEDSMTAFSAKLEDGCCRNHNEEI